VSLTEGLNRKGFGLRKEVAGDISRHYESNLVKLARHADFTLEWPGLSVRIAKEFGFCYGVERAIDYAYETRLRFPEARLFLTGEIIHNPDVNQRLEALGYRFLDRMGSDDAVYDELTPDDVVLIPAFGVSTDVLEKLKETGALLVDTTCGSVLNVWRNVEKFAKQGFTCLIHGKWAHEETEATASRTSLHPEGRYLIVRDMEETEIVARYIERGGDKRELLRTFRNAISDGFDPDRDLDRVGMANQTTMLSSESLAIAERIRRAMVARYGEEEAQQRFQSFDTICSATEDRQQAVLEMMESPPELVLIIGGYNSSNTGHLAEMCSHYTRCFHIASAEELLSLERIRHLPPGGKEPVETESWFPGSEQLDLGLTAGASTPDREIGAVIKRLLELLGIERGALKTPQPVS
jgi:4-hydroxy-3-methylbut-2-enyl diphosphate reductase